LHVLKKLILDLGGYIFEASRVSRIEHDNHHYPIHLHLTSGDEYTADRVVLATGPWVHYLLAELHLPVRLTRQFLLYFANLPISLFKLHTFPAFIADDLYGFPIHHTSNGYGSNWLKAASHTFGIPADPDEMPLVD